MRASADRPAELGQNGAVISFPGSENISTRKMLTDATFRISRLRSANVTPTSVSPNQSINEAITIMLQNDFSQLPVMNGERSVKGIVSWRSNGTRQLALGLRCEEVRECMENPRVLKLDDSLLHAIDEIVRNEHVLIKDPTDRICGIVTTSGLSMLFRSLTEPFLLLAEIENQIRAFISEAGFTAQEL